MATTTPRSENWERLLLFVRRNNLEIANARPPHDLTTLAERHRDEQIEPDELEALEGYVAALSAERGRMLELRWGLGGGPLLPRSVAAQTLGVSEGRADFLERRALRSLGRRSHVSQPSPTGPASFYTGDDPYGRTSSAPIRITGLDRQIGFLAGLVHDESGKALIFHRRQSFSRPDAGPLDVYEVVTSGGEHWDELLVDGYASADQGPPRPPPGYVFRRHMPVESRPEPNRGDNRHHRDFPLTFLRPDEPAGLYVRRHVHKVWMFGND